MTKSNIYDTLQDIDNIDRYLRMASRYIDEDDTLSLERYIKLSNSVERIQNYLLELLKQANDALENKIYEEE